MHTVTFGYDLYNGVPRMYFTSDEPHPPSLAVPFVLPTPNHSKHSSSWITMANTLFYFFLLAYKSRIEAYMQRSVLRGISASRLREREREIEKEYAQLEGGS